MLEDSVLVVVRSSGERTADLCVDRLVGLFSPASIFKVQTSPFSRAIIESLKIGMASNKEWLLCIDADVLVSVVGIKKLLLNIPRADANVFEIQGLVLDKFLPVVRPAGNHLFRREYAEKAIDAIPAEGTSLRPESDMLNRMSDAGFPWIQCDAIVGLHDYEQYRQDIYRKCFLHAQKHRVKPKQQG